MSDGGLRLGILASGSGTNLQAIVDACTHDNFPAHAAVVICNVAGAGAIERAQEAGVRVEVVSHGDFARREDFDARLVEILKNAEVDLVCLAGFMRIVTRVVLDAFPERVINIHPSLLPAFPGIDAQRQAFDAGVRFTGATIHFVDPGTDTGPIILQSVVPVLPDDDEEILRLRILATEHKLFPAAIQLIAEGRVKLDGRKVIVNGSPPSPQLALFNPGVE